MPYLPPLRPASGTTGAHKLVTDLLAPLASTRDLPRPRSHALAYSPAPATGSPRSPPAARLTLMTATRLRAPRAAPAAPAVPVGTASRARAAAGAAAGYDLSGHPPPARARSPRPQMPLTHALPRADVRCRRQARLRFPCSHCVGLQAGGHQEEQAGRAAPPDASAGARQLCYVPQSALSASASAP